MATNELSGWGTVETLLSTGLNSLANNSTALSAAVDNSSAHSIWDLLELVVTFGVAPTLSSPINIYLLPTLADTDTEYSDGSAGTPGTIPSPNLLVGMFLVRAVTTAQRLVLPSQCKVELPPGRFKYLLENKSGQAFSASGNTLKRRPYEMASA